MAVLRLAQYVEEQLSKKRSLTAILHEADESHNAGPQAAGGYASFAQLGNVRRMKIPDSGVW